MSSIGIRERKRKVLWMIARPRVFMYNLVTKFRNVRPGYHILHHDRTKKRLGKPKRFGSSAPVLFHIIRAGLEESNFLFACFPLLQHAHAFS